MTKNGAVEVGCVDQGPKDAPVLVLSGSLGSTLAMWEPLLPALRRFRVVRYDHRGHGGSPVPDGPYTIEDLGHDLIAMLDRLGVERASLAGVSLGGMVGMWVAANAPERIEHLVLLCTSARLGPAEAWRDRAQLVRRDGMSQVADAVVARWVTPGFLLREPAVASALRAMIASTPPEGYAACCEAIARWDFEDQLGSIRAPTLVVAGSSDEATPAVHAHVIGAGIPGARVVVVDGAAHVPVFEQPERVANLVLEHVGSLNSPKGQPS
jgi:3-oxoadipate enol-lactonase